MRAPRATIERIEALGERARAWVICHRDDFRLGGVGVERLMSVKRLAELGLVASTDRSTTGTQLCDFAWDELGKGAEITRALDEAPALAVTYLPFRLGGRRSLALEKRLAEPSWREGFRSWSPFVRQAVGATLKASDIAVSWDMRPGLETFSTHLAPDFAVRAAMAAHIVLWRTSFGRRPAALAAYERRAMDAWVPIASAALGDQALLDPLAEVLAAHAATGGAFVESAWQPLFGGQRRDGAVPDHTGGERFDSLYHPTLAAWLAATTTCASAQRAIASTQLFQAYAD
jgi:hypothetical protein